MRLLVIEDDTTLRESLCRQLAEAGFGVEQAADGEADAVERLCGLHLDSGQVGKGGQKVDG